MLPAEKKEKESSVYKGVIKRLAELGIDEDKLREIPELLPMLLGVKAIEVPLAFAGNPLDPRQVSADDTLDMEAAYAAQKRLNREEELMNPGFLQQMYAELGGLLERDGKGWLYSNNR